ncbi:MAG: peptidoglycan-associated lipoprotein Pal [Geobacter sp.]|nr:peptidoglycan-associated lipoprotein Pal [Geobacter sp.]
MKRHVVGLGLVLGCVMFVAGGCAKNEIVKKDESVAATAAGGGAPIKTEQVSEKPISQSSIQESTASEALAPISNAAELRTALDEIYFDFDKYTLSTKSRDTLLKNAGNLKTEPAAVVRIEGHCDERGSEQYNLALGEKRAKAAMQYLVTLGIPESRLSVISYGKEKPVALGHDEASWAKNRRDEFVIATE